MVIEECRREQEFRRLIVVDLVVLVLRHPLSGLAVVLSYQPIVKNIQCKFDSTGPP